jgi:Ca-activated chloride channel homolog
MSALAACARALVLLMDVSSSVDQNEWENQIRGTAQVFREPAFHRIIDSLEGGIAVRTIQWSDHPDSSSPWFRIRTAIDAEQYADQLEAMRRPFRGMTGLARAMQAGVQAFESVPCDPEKMILDVSGDGDDNVDGQRAVEDARDTAFSLGVTINAIAIMDRPDVRDVPDYFRNHVMTPGGFVVESEGYEAYGPAIRRKLMREIM